MAIVRLVHGDMFDGPTDMITIPCSTAGTVTGVVARRLEQFSLPHPGRMQLGQVEIRALDDADQVAQYVAFAASVFNYTSTFEAIAQIGEALGKATRERDAVRSISVPLLGAGAGGLSAAGVVTRVRAAFEEHAARDAVLSIFILREGDYRRLAETFEHEATLSSPAAGSDRTAPGGAAAGNAVADRKASTTFGTVPPPPRVFISHTFSESRDAWLDALYRFLRANGINARLDTYSLRPGMDHVQWMCNELQQADRVLLICDARYADRADGRHGGVGWETMLIQGDLYASMNRERVEGPVAASKYIPIVVTSKLDEGQPAYLATKLAFHWPPDADEAAKRDALLRELFGVPAEPPLGPRPSFA